MNCSIRLIIDLLEEIKLVQDNNIKEMKFNIINNNKYEIYLEENEKVHLIFYKYMLPFRLPIPNGGTININGILFAVYNKEYTHYSLQDGFAILPIKRTVIEAVVKINKKEKIKQIKNDKVIKKQQKTISEIFEKQLRTLNEFIEIIIAKHKPLNIYPVHYGKLVGSIFYQLHKYDGKLTEETPINILSLLSYSGVDDYQTLKVDEIQDLLNGYDSYKKHVSRIATLAGAKGERALHLYDYNSAIVQYNTMFEVIIATFVKTYYKFLTNYTTEKINNIIINTGFKNVINDHFLKKLKELQVKDYNEIKKCIDKYLAKEYLYRNKIVHEGEVFFEDEALAVREKVFDLSALLNHNINNANKNDFVDFYNKNNRNTIPEQYTDAISRYRN